MIDVAFHFFHHALSDDLKVLDHGSNVLDEFPFDDALASRMLEACNRNLFHSGLFQLDSNPGRSCAVVEFGRIFKAFFQLGQEVLDRVEIDNGESCEIFSLLSSLLDVLFLLDPRDLERFKIDDDVIY